MMTEIGIHFGAMADPIVEQLIKQGVRKVPTNINLLQELADASVLLAIHGIITDSEKHKVHKRLMCMIKRGMK